MTCLRPIIEASRAIVSAARARRYKPFPRSDMGRRELAAWVRLHGGLNEAATLIDWDLDPIRWAMEHEIQVAREVAVGLRNSADIQAAE